ncbi:hypothetical protein RMN57_02740 [Kitasatospora sp. CM 4170]|uniref:Lipoprotein n=1 Tax=Kitasatospora aburaviensis TaxID=67265 RepID=A0ABW1EUT3_9ACTN|nr:hypothetical protein [Kitasatospora sp. CM 4170]WNM43694.1 hypothetical protein RMN57_02740 [Kitasatospora sp. CM 4170]
MKMIKGAGIRVGVPAAVAAIAVLVAGCGTQRAGEVAGGGGPARTAAAAPSTPLDPPCPGETPTPTPTRTSTGSAPNPALGDHYAENNGFKVPLPLHGQHRCDGLAAAARIKSALEPLRQRGDFTPESSRNALTALGYAAAKVQVYQNGSTGISFLVDASPLCLEGRMDTAVTKAEPFGGYPDHTGCDVPRGGH